jgi:hypothetical protein
MAFPEGATATRAILFAGRVGFDVPLEARFDQVFS